MLPEDNQTLLDAAREAAEVAYAPYSHFQVGAALRLKNGRVITGCNVENASYGLTVCAERVAVWKAVSEGHTKIDAVAVWAQQRPHGSVTPCGACRQVLVEFGSPDLKIIFADAQTGAPKTMTLAQLLPEAFTEMLS